MNAWQLSATARLSRHSISEPVRSCSPSQKVSVTLGHLHTEGIGQHDKNRSGSLRLCRHGQLHSAPEALPRRMQAAPVAPRRSIAPLVFGIVNTDGQRLRTLTRCWCRNRTNARISWMQNFVLDVPCESNFPRPDPKLSVTRDHRRRCAKELRVSPPEG